MPGLTEASIIPEMDTQPQHGWLFDIDGVVINPSTKRVEEAAISDFLVDRLRIGEPVALVTGRALNWVMQWVAPGLIERAHDDLKLLDSLYICAEFGGSSVEFERGNQHHFVDENIRVPKNIVIESEEAVKPFADTHFVDREKETMVSLEMTDGMDVEDFRPEQLKLASILREIVEKHDTKGQFEVHVDSIATNIRDRRANKHYATQKVLEWFKTRGLKTPQEFYAFGDSKGDLEMPQELTKMGIKCNFVFVGRKSDLEGMKFDFNVEQTEQQWDKGVVEFIDTYNNQT